MGKLDQHADRIKELYAKTGTVLETRAQMFGFLPQNTKWMPSAGVS
jgi:hypothetical protein